MRTRPGSWLLAVLMSLPVGGAVGGDVLSPRVVESGRAMEAFKGHHNFADGRGIHVFPGIYRFQELLESRWVPIDLTGTVRYQMGFNMEGRRPIGLFSVRHAGTRVGVLGCVACHSGRAAGRTYIGLGNKNIDVGRIGKLVKRFEKPYRWTRNLRPPAHRPLIDQAMAFVGKLVDPRTTNHTQGLVPVSLIATWFYESAGQTMPEDVAPGPVKVPHHWGYAEKKKVGLFYDGVACGDPPFWVATNELAAGQTPETIRRISHNFEKIDEWLGRFLPPRYPFAIDREKANRGKAVFETSCRGCHGEYRTDPGGLPIYESPRFIRWEVVRTDPERLSSFGREFWDMVRQNPLPDLIRIQPRPPGYFAPRLDGIWARFPYFHNGSVPTLHDVLVPPEDRPRFWALRDAGEIHRFDPVRVGLTLPGAGTREARVLEEKARAGARNVASVDRPGSSNQGHPFGNDLTGDQRADLIEYLKTL